MLTLPPSRPTRRHKLPRQLREFKLLCRDASKPLVLLALLSQLPPAPTIVFAASVETAHRCMKACVGHPTVMRRSIPTASAERNRRFCGRINA